MPESRRSLSLSFIVRLWLEREGDHDLRGRVTRVSERGPDEQQPVSRLSDITDFIETSLEQEGMKVKRASRWRWWRAPKGKRR